MGNDRGRIALEATDPCGGNEVPDAVGGSQGVGARGFVLRALLSPEIDGHRGGGGGP